MGASPATPSEWPIANLIAHFERLRTLDPPTTLGVDPAAAAPELRKAFFGLARDWHPSRFALRPPDVRGVAEEIFILINRAHDALARPPRPGRRIDTPPPPGVSLPRATQSSNSTPSRLARSTPPITTPAAPPTPTAAPLDSDPDVIAGLAALADYDARRAQTRFDRAIARLASDPRLGALREVAIGRQLQSTQRTKEARAHYAAALALDPACAPARDSLAKLDEQATGKRSFFRRLLWDE